MDIEQISFPFVLVLSQSCDLLQEYRSRWGAARIRPAASDESQYRMESGKDDKCLLGVLCLPLYNMEHFILGEHLSELGLSMSGKSLWKSDRKKILQSNRDARYHCLSFGESVSVPQSVADFKHYLVVPGADVYHSTECHRVAAVPEWHREQILHRFGSYLTRIGIPDDDE